MAQPSDWHRYAKRLHSRGYSLREIGRVIGVDHKSIHRLVSDKARIAHNATVSAYKARKKREQFDKAHASS